ncbi:Uncharacterized protein Adt_01164 [Abeliophyllum distichum]|uniref:Uncharacterized protein n=1 Tax=Abeliophyllum distichum TaxID=126358 RepID=A0ABD1VSE4_9LAMI
MTRLCTCSGSVGYKLGLNSKRNQLAEASCKACGGRFLVNGIEPVSESMLETVGPEVMNSTNPEFNWKTVTKGRRSKKPVARSLNGVAKVGNRSPKRVGNFSGSDSEKFGEAGLGQRSSGKEEHVPIKKRRHLLRSPSPNPRAVSMRSHESSSPQTHTSSPISEDFEPLSDQYHSPGHGSLNSYSNQLSRDFDGSAMVKVGKGVDHGIFPAGAEELLCSSEDFSGIELLAAAACINSMDDDVGNADKEDLVEDSSIPECSVACTCPTELKVGFTCAELGNPPSKESDHLDSFKCTLVPVNAAASQSTLESVKDGAVQRSVSSKVDRLHWDLNTVMDAWDEPVDDSDVGNTSKDINDVGILGGKLDGECCGDHKDCDIKGTGVEFSNLRKEENNLEKLSDSDRTSIDKKCSPIPERCFLEPVNFYADMGTCCESTQIDDDKSNSAQVISQNSDVDTSIQVVDKDNSALTELPCSSRFSESEEKMNGTAGSVSILQGEYCCSNMEFGKSTSSGTIQNVVQNLSSHEVQVLELSTSVNDTEDSQKTSELPDIRISLRESMSSITCKRPDIDNSGSNSTEVDFSHPSSNRGNFPALVTFITDGQSVAIAEGKGRDERVSVASSIISDSQGHIKSEETVAKHEDDYVSNEGQTRSILQGVCKGDSGGGQNIDPNALDVKIGVLDDCHDSNVSQDNHGHMVDGDEVTKFQGGYDSPYEDGELRGSVLYSWEDNEVENGENECVDYDSDGRNGDGSDAADYPGSDIVDGGSEGSLGAKKKFLSTKRFSETDLNKGGSVNHCLRRHFTNNDTEKVIGGKIESNAGSGTTFDQSIDVVVEEDDDSERRRRMVDLTDAVDGKGPCMDEFGSRISRGKLQSRIEGPSSSVATGGKDVFVQQCRLRRLGGAYSRPERDVSPEKYPVRYRPASHARERDGGDSQWTYWGSRNHYTSRYHGPEGHGPTRPRTAINDSTNKFGGLDSHDQRQSANYSSRGSYRPSIRRRSPVDRDDYFGIQRKMPLARGTGNNRTRGNSGNYSRRVSRDIREDFHEPVPDDAPRMLHYLSRRENSFSPNPGRGSHMSLAHRKSCSRSRSRSPRPWNLHRERNLGSRRHSRSPDFRSNTRTRLPYSKPSFASDYGEGYMSPPRGGCFSPQRNCRWVGDRNFLDNRLRHRRSPVRMFRRNERFDTNGSSGRMKSDDSFRPTMRPGRYSFMANGDRGCKFEAGYEDRIHRVRLSDDDGSIRRFPHDVANNFDASNNSNNEDDVLGTDRRDVPRSARDSKRSFNI